MAEKESTTCGVRKMYFDCELLRIFVVVIVHRSERRVMFKRGLLKQKIVLFFFDAHPFHVLLRRPDSIPIWSVVETKAGGQQFRRYCSRPMTRRPLQQINCKGSESALQIRS